MTRRRAVLRKSVQAAAAALAVLASGCGAAVPRTSSSRSSLAASPSPSPPASPTQSPRISPTAAQPCGLGGQGPATIQHVVLIIMENRAYSEVIGSPDAPYINRLASVCGLATGYQAVAHPSLPNYLALTSGSTRG